MNNGKSRLIPPLPANLMAMILFLFNAAFCITNMIWTNGWWLSLIAFFTAIIIFFIEGNAFVKKCSVQRILLYAVSLLSTLLLHWLFGNVIFGKVKTAQIIFHVIGYVIRGLVALSALISAFQSYNGYCFNVPLLGRLTSVISKKLGVF